MRKINITAQYLYQPVSFPSNPDRTSNAGYLFTLTSILILLLFSFTADAQVNNTVDSLHIPDISADPVNKKARQQEQILEKDRLYKPGTTDIIQGRGINIDKADLDKYFPNGVNFYLTDAQIQAQIDELKKQELYKNMAIGAAFLVFAIIVCVYIKMRTTKKALL